MPDSAPQIPPHHPLLGSIFMIITVVMYLLMSFTVISMFIFTPIEPENRNHLDSLPLAKIKRDDAKLLIVGDVMLDRHVRTLMTKNGLTYPFEKITDILSDHSQ